MKASELRIGNWVNNNEEDYQITSATIAQLERGDSTAKAIPLTPEWLERFDKIPWLSRDIGGYFVWFNGEKIYIKYVHQLQNLYFALTGVELGETKVVE